MQTIQEAKYPKQNNIANDPIVNFVFVIGIILSMIGSIIVFFTTKAYYRLKNTPSYKIRSSVQAATKANDSLSPITIDYSLFQNDPNILKINYQRMKKYSK